MRNEEFASVPKMLKSCHGHETMYVLISFYSMIHLALSLVMEAHGAHIISADRYKNSHQSKSHAIIWSVLILPGQNKDFPSWLKLLLPWQRCSKVTDPTNNLNEGFQLAFIHSNFLKTTLNGKEIFVSIDLIKSSWCRSSIQIFSSIFWAPSHVSCCVVCIWTCLVYKPMMRKYSWTTLFYYCILKFVIFHVLHWFVMSITRFSIIKQKTILNNYFK